MRIGYYKVWNRKPKKMVHKNNKKKSIRRATLAAKGK